MHRRCYNRTASTLITIFGAITNAAVAIQVLAAWHTFKWEPESEWESSGDKWQLDGLKVIWALLFVYFSSAASVCTVGLVGILKNKSSHVRFYRDYSIADFSFCAFSLILATYGAFLGTARAGVCEEFSHHPELMRNMLEMGLNLENCERWLERAVFAVLAVLFVIMVIRVSPFSFSFYSGLKFFPNFQLHFLLAVSNYYSHLTRHHRSPSSFSSSHLTPLHAMQRIFLLPNNNTNVGDLEHCVDMDFVYAPVPRHSLPKELQDQAAEAWISNTIPASPNSSNSTSTSSLSNSEHRSHQHHRRHHRHHSSHSHRRRSGSPSSQTGTIKLEISPNEGLLPAYTSVVNGERKA
ncbi:hypothetical protein BYT27DRAFT_6644015 [Phlegmacium glaucopus]|nr:hypothetical protein BYT27DRAFT_6644015 [Phlegmacium glaucopus]